MLDGELHDHRTCPKNIPMAQDVVAVDLGEYPPVLQPPIERLVTRPDATLHLEVLDGVDVVLGALDFVRMPTVAVVGLDAFVRLKEVCQTGGEDLDVGPRPGGVRALDPGPAWGRPSKNVGTTSDAWGGRRRGGDCPGQ